MKLLDRYILKKFLSAFFFVVLVLISIIVVIDFTEKNDDFIKRNADAHSIIFDYYLNFIPYYANLLSPITVFIATVFVTAQLASRTEIIAILSSGVSFRRVMVPYLIGSAIIGGIIFYLNGWVIPDANKVRVEFEKNTSKTSSTTLTVTFTGRWRPNCMPIWKATTTPATSATGLRWSGLRAPNSGKRLKLNGLSGNPIPKNGGWKLTKPAHSTV